MKLSHSPSNMRQSTASAQLIKLMTVAAAVKVTRWQQQQQQQIWRAVQVMLQQQLEGEQQQLVWMAHLSQQEGMGRGAYLNSWPVRCVSRDECLHVTTVNALYLTTVSALHDRYGHIGACVEMLLTHALPASGCCHCGSCCAGHSSSYQSGLLHAGRLFGSRLELLCYEVLFVALLLLVFR
jgi:hypothetical protein